MNWHLLSVDKVIELTDSSINGLSSTKAEIRLSENGPNELQEKKKKPVWVLFLNQFKDFMIFVLILAAVISGLVGDLTDTIIILIIVILNAIIGFVQEYKAGKAMDALKKMVSFNTIVYRNGIPVTVPSSELVVGDVVMLESGNAVPSDLRLTEINNLKIDESALTGESVSVDKSVSVLEDEHIPLGDRFNLAFKGTMVTKGKGKGIVVATGMDTEIGKIARLLQSEENMTPLQKRMNDFGKKLSYIIICICIILFVVGILRNEDPVTMLLVSISLAVAAIPEALPALITISLALGAKRLVKQNALIRKLHAVETLGSVSFICSDKTGTLTVNKMKVMEVFESENSKSGGISMFNLCLALNNDVIRNPDNTLTGDPTETAIVDYFREFKSNDEYEEIIAKFPKIAELPFDSERKCMSTIHDFNGKYIMFSKGAAETIMKNFASADENGVILKYQDMWAEKGLRVLLFSYKYLDKLPEEIDYKSLEKDLMFAGMAGLIDPPRLEVQPAIEECRTAGIKTVMITGDHPATAFSIAKQIGIPDESDLVVTGAELNNMSEKEYQEKVLRISVYARVNPEQKLNIVKALQSKDHFVSMTGDGVNDAPSLKAANIGVAMGINGTDVSKEASDMILLDDNFSTIVKAVKEGRRIYDNIRRFVKYIMTCNSAEIWTIFLAPLIGLPMPLLPIHLLWINLVTDGLPGLALAGEKPEDDIMRQPPRKSDESIFAGGIGYHIFWVGLLMAGLTLGTQAWAISGNKEYWQTMVFLILSLSQLGHVMAIRSDRTFLYKQGLFSNLPLLYTVVFTYLLQIAIIYIPFANEIFKTKPLEIPDLLICIFISTVVFHAVEFEKWIKRKFIYKKS
ncbi:MAG: Calcium-transporting ATPase 1 [Ignavibacteria bacterium]|nr:Calcium-transporting ATPase 1 [Ignavibacteria bacterium]